MSLQTIIHAARALAVGPLKPIALVVLCACAGLPSVASNAADDGADRSQKIAKRSNEPKSYIIGSAEATELYRACAVDQRPAACKLLIRGDEAKGFATAHAIAFAHITLGRLAERDGNAARALKHYRQAKQRDPSLELLDEKIDKLSASRPEASPSKKSTDSETPKSVSRTPRPAEPRDNRSDAGSVANSKDDAGGAVVASDTPRSESLSAPSCPPVCDYEATYPITTGSLPSVDREDASNGARMDVQPRRPGGASIHHWSIPERVIRESSPTPGPEINPATGSRVAAISAVFQPPFAPTASPRGQQDKQALRLTPLLSILSVMTIMTLLTVLWSRAAARARTRAVPSLTWQREIPPPDMLAMPSPAPVSAKPLPVCPDGDAAGPAGDADETRDTVEQRDTVTPPIATSVPDTSTPTDETRDEVVEAVEAVEAAPEEAPAPVRDLKAERLVLSGLAEQVYRDALVQACRPDLDSRLLQPIKTATQEVLELQAARASQEAMRVAQDRDGTGPSGGKIPPVAALTAELTALWSAILRHLPMGSFRVAGPDQKISFAASSLFDVLENKQGLLDELIAIGKNDDKPGRSGLLAMSGSGAIDGLNAATRRTISAAAQGDPALKNAPGGFDPDKTIRALFKGGPIEQVLDLKVFEEDDSRPHFSFVFARDHEARAGLIAGRFASDVAQLFDRQAMTLVLDQQGQLASHVRDFMSTDAELNARDALAEIYAADQKWAGAFNPFDLDLDISSLDHFDKERLLGAAMDIQTQAFENLVGRTILRGHTRTLRHLLRAAHSIPNASLETLLNLLQPDGLDRFANELARIKSRSTANFFKTEFQAPACRDFAEAFRSALGRRLEDYRLRQLTCARATAERRAKLFRPGTVTILDLSLLGAQENGSNPFAVMCLASLQTKRLVREAQGASLHVSAYVDDIAACLGRSTNCDEIVFRQVGSSTSNLSLGVASAKDRWLYASVAARAF